MAAFALCAVILVVSSVHVYGGLDWESQRLNQFQQKYNNSRSDIIFLMDDSYSVSDTGFTIEKKFINSLLSQISVQPIASRVAVISFSHDVRKSIDYIDYDQYDKNKCTFTTEFARITHRKGSATNMKSAFSRAQLLLDDAKKNGNKRSNTNTVIVLLTDGQWNWGGNPRDVAAVLRTNNAYHAEVISVGVDGAKTSQLLDVAGTSNNVIFAKSFDEFENLAARIRGDQMEMLYQPVYKPLCGKTCDANARCSCGTISGIYQCACGAGYYGSGDPGRCFPCPFGRYKKYASPDPCNLCPAHSSHSITGSKDVSDCKCFEGYKGNPGLGIPCKVVECDKFPTTIANGVVQDCGYKFKETCTFTCNDFYHIQGETTQSKKVFCQKTGKWNVDRQPTCIPVTCPKLPVPPHMNVVCDNSNNVNSKCTFSCHNGYRRNGTDARTCRPDGQWSGEQPRCSVIQCPTLRRVDNVNITPMRCINSKTNYNDGCAYACKSGFTKTSGSDSRLCQADGTWSGDEMVCEDKTPPTITCPANVVVDTDKDEATREIAFEMPTVIDNSEALAQTKITVEQHPNVKSPHKFPIGVTNILFTARDEAGNQDSCTYRVDVQDRQAPVINCPADIEKTSTAAGVTSVSVTWDIPTYKDNSGTATMTSTYNPPHSIPVNEVFAVKYTVEDSSRNKAECTIRIKINSAQCPARDPPINGALPCNYIPRVGDFCHVQCMDPYEVNAPKSPFYICNTQKQWTAMYPYSPQWPDCTAKQAKEGQGQKVEWNYYSGNCHDSIAAQDQIKQNFKTLLNMYLMRSSGSDCSRPDNAVVCKSENVKITCGKIQDSRKRSTNQNLFTIEVDVEVISKSLPDSDVTNIVNRLATAATGVKSSSLSEAGKLRTMTVDGDTLTLNAVQTVGHVTGVCNGGAVLGVDPKNTETIGKCVSCVAGKYFDSEKRDCVDCPVGTYTETPGRLGCTNCPKGKTTAKAGSHNKTDCRAPCPPGSYSSTGLENCRLCGTGYYQPVFYGKQCLKCPGSTTTLISGASKLLHCGMRCQAGTYSATGVEPCLPCPKGYYQSGTGKTTCVACSAPLFTLGEGSTISSQCTRINECSSNPCNNGATCVDEVNGFTCTCKPGFLGKTCDQEKNECASNPCFGSSYCVDLVNGFQCVCPAGFKGKYCEERDIECTAGKCQNGGKCSETPDGFACSCAAGFTGTLCERTINECASNPCQNNAVCIDSANGFRCQCSAGFTGELCEVNVDDCKQNQLCLNEGACVDGDNGFSCSCKTGFAGSRCEVNVDDCASNPCKNGAKCVDLVSGYKCNCAPTYYGQQCQNQRTDADFDLEFGRDVQSYSEASLHSDLSAFTISFWMKGKSDDIESGTVLSYAVDVGDSFVDNALVLQDPDAFLLTIMGKEIETKISVKDGLWHHVAVVWSSQSGSYISYQDGIKMNEGANFQAGKKIPTGGIFILGQEQDEVGRNFSMAEAFDGSISQFNVWNKVLAAREIHDISRYRCPGVLGNQLAWPDFLQTKVEAKQVNQFCTVKNTKFSLWMSRSVPSSGNEHEPPACSNAVSAQCLSTSNQNVQGLNLIKTVCSGAGFTCQQSVQGHGKACPDFKARFECPYSKGTAHCASSPCKNGATCLETSMAYRCICRNGYMGANCDTEVPCHSIKSFANGAVTQSGNQFTFSCNNGYRLSGSSSLTCRTGSLSGAVPSCVDINECATNNGGCQHRCTNTMGSFKCTCNKGYKASGSSCVDENECQQNNGNCQQTCVNSHGSYRCRCSSGYQLSIDQRSCADINECTAGSHQCQHYCINTLGSYSCGCRPGYVLSGDKKSCTRRSCPALGSPSHGSVSAANNLYGTSATISCNKGYKLIGSSVRQCARNGQWTGSAAVCQRVVCHPLGSIPNGAFTKTGESYDSTYSFTCSSGYLLIGDSQRKCQQNGEWSGQMPRCVPYNCRPLTPPSNGRIVGTSLVTGSSVIVYCNKGYMLPRGSSNFRTCLSSGSWSNSQLTCTAITCQAPQGISNGVISSTGNTYGKTVTYTCNAGYGASGPNVRVCEENGEWSGSAPTCVSGSCGYPGAPANGALSASDFTYGKKVTYSCDNGFRLIGESERLCLNSGRWTGSLPQCQEINCGDPGTPSNGVKHGTEYKIGKSVSFDCNPGYSLSGSSSRTCGQDGNWDGTQPRCLSGVCGSSGLVGPSGSFTSRNYPNGYGLNEYCRWAISVKQTMKAALTVKSLKTERIVDRLEIRDGSSGKLMSILSGLLNQPITYTSNSNKLDVKFVSDGKQIAAAEGFEASYHAASCGGLITNIGETFQSPNYPSQYPNGITCIWQIVINGPIELKFAHFDTFDNDDKLEVWESLTQLDASTLIGQYSGPYGSLLRIQANTGKVYVKFSTGSNHASTGFKATIKDSAVVIGK